jgi:TonB family protein
MQQRVFRFLQAAMVIIAVAVMVTSVFGQTSKKSKKKAPKPAVAKEEPGSGGVPIDTTTNYPVRVEAPTYEEEPSIEGFVSVEREPQPTYGIQSLVEYPEKAKKAGLEGKVIVSALIDVDGSVIKVEVDKSDYPIFEKAAQEAMTKMRFTPALQNGIPVKLWYTLPIVFSLHERTENVVVMRSLPLPHDIPPDSLTYKHHFFQGPKPPVIIPARPAAPIEDIAEYPSYLKAEGIEGQVRLSVLVDTNGILKDYKFEYSDHPHFELAIREVMEKVKFIPAEVGGRKVEKWSTIVVNFRLPQEMKK